MEYNLLEKQLEHIDTSDVAKSYASLIERNKNKTYFLNGPWGSGKSTLLDDINEHFTELEEMTLNLWQVKNNKSVMSKLAWLTCKNFIKQYPLISGIKVGVALAIGLVSICGIVSNYKALAFFITVSISLIPIVKTFSESIYLKITKCIGKKIFQNKVLIIDDFDRLDSPTQEETYKIFNTFSDKLTFIFVGDFSKIYNGENPNNQSERFLEKIIDLRLDLPLKLLPRVFWPKYTASLNANLSLDILNNGRYSPEKTNILFQQFITDNISLRGREKYHEMLYRELVEHDKDQSVNTVQLMAMIYLYQFNPDIYYQLKNGNFDILSPKQEDGKEAYKPPLLEILYDGRKNNDFLNASNQYFVFESVTSMKTSELLSIVRDADQLSPFIRSDKNSEVLDYISSMSESEFKGIEITFYDAVAKVVSDKQWFNKVVAGILKRQFINWETLRNYKIENQQLSESQTEEVPEGFRIIMGSMDFSQQVRLLIDCTSILGDDIVKMFSKNVDFCENEFPDKVTDLLNQQLYPEYIFALINFDQKSDGFISKYLGVLEVDQVKRYIFLSGRIINDWSTDTQSIATAKMKKDTQFYKYLQEKHQEMGMELNDNAIYES